MIARFDAAIVELTSAVTMADSAPRRVGRTKQRLSGRDVALRSPSFVIWRGRRADRRPNGGCEGPTPLSFVVWRAGRTADVAEHADG